MEKRFRFYVIAAALVGLLGSTALFFAVAQLQSNQLLAQFQRDATRLGMVIEQRLSAHTRALELLDGDVSALEADRLLQRFPDLTGLVWAPRQNRGFPVANGFGDIQTDRLVGIDIASDPDLAAALRQLAAAPATPVIVPTPAIFGVDLGSTLLVVVAAGEGGAVGAPGLAGVFAATLAFERAIDASLTRFGSDDMQLVISHSSPLFPALYTGGADARQLRRGEAYSVPIELIKGQHWNLQVTPTSQYFATRSNRVAQLVFCAALLLTALTTLYLEITLRRADQVKLLIHRSTEKLNIANRQLELLTLTDELTGSVNRRGFDQALQSEWGRAKRDQSALTLLMVDIDYFKSYNDHYGHPAGDKCLKMVARALAGVPGRLGDLVARYGGEEFAVILPNTEDLEAAVAKRCREAVENLGIPHEHSEAGSVVTVSIGSATCWPHRQEDSKDILELADNAMYDAKAAGRNRVQPSVEAVSAA